MRYRLMIVLAVAAAVGACAPVAQMPVPDPAAVERERLTQRELVSREQNDAALRVQRIVSAILIANADLCAGRQGFFHGMVFGIRYVIDDDQGRAGEIVYRRDDRVRVLGVVPERAGERAGLMPGDALVSVNGWAVPRGRDAVAVVTERLAPTGQGGGVLDIAYERAGTPGQARVIGERACAYQPELLLEDGVNAHADGRKIVFNMGMVRFAASDDDLATVAGHEFAHNLMGHIDKQKTNRLIGTLVDVLAARAGVDTDQAYARAGARAYSQSFEAEADYVGLYAMARAGFRFADAANFWRNMGVRHPASIRGSHLRSHPSTPERFVALQRTAEAIADKKAKGLALLPDLQSRPAATASPQPESPGQ